MKRIYLMSLCCIVMGSIKAQVTTQTGSKPLVPKHGKFGGQRFMKKVVIPPPNRQPLPGGDVLKEGVYKFAEAIPASINLVTQSGSSSANGNRIFCLKVKSVRATSLSLEFENFHLPDGAEMYLYNTAGTILTGPVTSLENRPSGTWGSDVYNDDAVIVEVKVPEEMISQFSAKIVSVGYGFRELPSASNRFGDAGSCNVNAICPLGNGWDFEQRSVALILDSQGGSWTGTLVNNTCNNRIPYLLTASHVATLAIAQPIAKWRFIFQYKSSTCTPQEDGSMHLLFNGAKLRANSSWSDFALVEMDQTPPQNSGITYAGWDRSGTVSPNGTSFHHPQGDVMKVSYDAEPVLRKPYPGATASVYWQTDWNQGVTEKGSSGSALFNNEHKIIGQLRGGYSYCAGPNLKDYYGAFDVSWIGSGTAASSLKDWLDPLKTGVTVLQGIAANHYSIAGPAQFCATGSYTITNLPAGAVVNWQQPSPTGIAALSVSGNQATLTRITDGVVTIQATINLCGKIITMASGEIRSGSFPFLLQSQQTSCNSVQFTLAGNLPVATYNWSTGAGDILFNGTSSTAVTAVPYIDATGSIGSVAVSTANSCGGTSASYADFIPYQQDIQYGMYQPLLNGDHIVATVNPSEFIKEYYWYLNGELVQSGTSNYYNSSTTPAESSLLYCGNNSLKVEAVTDCGIFLLAYDDHIEKACGNTFKVISDVQLYPNPAVGNITVSLKNNTRERSAEAKSGKVKFIASVIIYDKFGTIRKVQRFGGLQQLVNMNISGLQPGIYFIEISDGINRVKEPLSVK
jgi:lysyl endopeptidase